jgi:3-dehydroquinate dehydratase-2
MTSVFVINGPNLNLLGQRKPEVYGRTTLAEVEQLCREETDRLDLELVFRQSNHEGELVDWLQECGLAVRAGTSIGAVYNPAGHTHTSVALHDAVEALDMPVVELHISNIHAREDWRHHSYISLVARGIVMGFGVRGYPLAINGLYQLSHRQA